LIYRANFRVPTLILQNYRRILAFAGHLEGLADADPAFQLSARTLATLFYEAKRPLLLPRWSFASRARARKVVFQLNGVGSGAGVRMEDDNFLTRVLAEHLRRPFVE